MNYHYSDRKNWIEANKFQSSSHKQDFIATSCEPFYKSNKQNVVPGIAQIQGLISTLNINKYEFNILQGERLSLTKLTATQNMKIQSENLRQMFESQKQEELFQQNQKMLNQIEELKRQKPSEAQKIRSITKAIQSRYLQIMQLKKMKQELSKEKVQIEKKLKDIQQEDIKIQTYIIQLELTAQQKDNQLFNLREKFRENQVKKCTVQSAFNSVKRQIIQIKNEIRSQNQEYKNLIKCFHDKNERIKKLRQQKQQHQINCLEYLMKNKQIDCINIKLKSDLENCKDHLEALLKNNDILKNNIQKFSYVDEKVTRIMNRNQLKKY